jgi:hypothetical protein
MHTCHIYTYLYVHTYVVSISRIATVLQVCVCIVCVHDACVSVHAGMLPPPPPVFVVSSSSPSCSTCAYGFRVCVPMCVYVFMCAGISHLLLTRLFCVCVCVTCVCIYIFSFFVLPFPHHLCPALVVLPISLHSGT